MDDVRTYEQRPETDDTSVSTQQDGPHAVRQRAYAQLRRTEYVGRVFKRLMGLNDNVAFRPAESDVPMKKRSARF